MASLITLFLCGQFAQTLVSGSMSKRQIWKISKTGNCLRQYQARFSSNSCQGVARGTVILPAKHCKEFHEFRLEAKWPNC
jgi:hypothetical protein